MSGGRKERGQRQRRHHREVEKDRCGGRRGKTMQHVEHAAIQRDQRDQQQIGKGDPGQLDGEPPLFGLVGKTGSQQAYRLRHEQQRHHQQYRLRDEQQRKDAVGEQPGRGLAALAMDVGVGRDEGGVEGALGENRPKIVRQPPRHVKGVGDRTGAEDRREHDVARQTG